MKAHCSDSGAPAQVVGEAALTDWPALIVVGVLAIVTVLSFPSEILHLDKQLPSTTGAVFFYGWITALSTALGVAPLLFIESFSQYWLGLSNAIAAGMMLAASCTLAFQGCTIGRPDTTAAYSTALGVALGLAFIKLSEYVLHVSGFEEDKGYNLMFDSAPDKKIQDNSPKTKRSVDNPSSKSLSRNKKILLIVFVMTLHSMSEGIGIGVSFGGEAGKGFGVFISLSLAVHNVPEGLAVALVMVPRKTSCLRTALWAVFTSLPQPIMAVAAFWFVEHFLPLLPIGLGFAAGAMLWVALFQLIPESIADTKELSTSLLITGVGFVVMLGLQQLF